MQEGTKPARQALADFLAGLSDRISGLAETAESDREWYLVFAFLHLSIREGEESITTEAAPLLREATGPGVDEARLALTMVDDFRDRLLWAAAIPARARKLKAIMAEAAHPQQTEGEAVRGSGCAAIEGMTYGALTANDIATGSPDAEEALIRMAGLKGKEAEDARATMARFQEQATGVPAIVAEVCRIAADARRECCPRLNQAAAKLRAAAGDDAEPEEDEPPANGPFSPDGFAWDGRKHTGLTPIPWRLVDYLWPAKNRTAHFYDLAVPVWREAGAVVTADRVGSARREANTFFARHTLPWRVSISGESVTLKKTAAGQKSP